MRRLLACLVLVAACSGGGREKIVVGSKNFTEQRILGELLAQTVESIGVKAERRLDLGGTFVCDKAIRAGQIDLYAEYTGTALTAILQQKPSGDRAAVLAQVRTAYAPAGLAWTEPLGFENTFALVMRGEQAAKQGVKTISDIAPRAERWRAGFGYEFTERADGYPGLARTYDLKFKDTRIMDLGLLYRALVENKVDVVAGNSTDGLIEHLKLAVLEDDRGYFPPYEAAPVVRQAVLDAHPELGRILQRLAGKLDAVTMRRLNYAVDGEHKDPPTVVREWRAAAGM